MQNKSAAAKVQANLKELFKGKLAPGDAYVKFQLTSDITALLSMKQVQESLIVEPGQVTPLPRMPESVMGIISSRDRVFCVFDLAQLLTLNSELIAPRQYQIIVLQTTDETPIYLGLAVANLQGIIRFHVEKIQSSTESFPAKITPFVSGGVQQVENILPILELEHILQVIKTIC